jgi:hypothetical protein
VSHFLKKEMKVKKILGVVQDIETTRGKRGRNRSIRCRSGRGMGCVSGWRCGAQDIEKGMTW